MRALLCVLLLTVPGAASAGLLGQNDAGSGGDAGDSAATSVPVAPGTTHRGRLFGVLATPASSPVLDHEDWYRVELDAGIVTLRARTLEGSPVLFELRSPDEALATWTLPGLQELETRAFANAPGAWYVRALQINARPAEYEFSISSAPGSGFGSAGRYAAFRVEVPEGGSYSFDLEFALATSGAPLRRDLIFAEDGEWTSYDMLRGTLWYETKANVMDLHVSAEARTNGWAWFREKGRAEFTTPGVHHLILLAHADEAYTSFIEVSSTGGASASASFGPLIAPRVTDFDAPLAVAAGAASATVAGSYEVSVEHALVGLYMCGEPAVDCSFTRPDGSGREVPMAFLFDDVPGTWTFRRGASAEEGAFPLFAADIDLG